MKIQNPRRRIITAVGAATIALATAGAGQAGAVGGPEYGIVRISEAASAEPQSVGTSLARRPLPLESLQQVRSATRAAPVVVGDFDWADAGVGAGIAVGAMLLAALGAGVVPRRRKLEHS